MSTEDMPTTNQSPEEATLVDKIPPTVAEGFKQVAKTTGNAVVGISKQVFNTGMNT